MSRRTWRREEIRGRRVRGYGFQGEHDHGAEGVVRRGRPEFFLRRRAREWGITRSGQVLTSFGPVCAAVRRAVPGYPELDGRALGARLYLIYIESARLPYHGQHLQAREEYSKDLHEILHRGRMCCARVMVPTAVGRVVFGAVVCRRGTWGLLSRGSPPRHVCSCRGF